MPVEVGCADLAETSGQANGAAFTAHTVLSAGCSHPSPGMPGNGGDGAAPLSAARSGAGYRGCPLSRLAAGQQFLVFPLNVR